MKFVDPEAFVEKEFSLHGNQRQSTHVLAGMHARSIQELWWDLAKTFVAPIPSTVAELEPIKQRMRRFTALVWRDRARDF